ncbi:zinc ABC transporter solute-binding protein [Nitrogeniibacter mangrovi]|uniref:Zinc ABC transporter solute-binding protein n=1 Tax=Nitrogeniibacter mangrovi TaxID=2016596 RepID=A0A6C1AY72_9RHOO|nr:zinc ABC transporter substrate-binding protein [Nitrogeniibacter mangrovi]QID16287.1 zinc ABC transporter solute-binding protein [Nitrogeniibacter mangrovi]
MKHAILALTLAFALVTGAQADPALRVLTSFTILKDFAEQVGGDRVAVTTLVGFDQDAHAFDPRASDIRRISEADLVIVNGLGFDPWMARMLASARFAGPVVVASKGVTPLQAGHAPGHEDDGHAGHAHGDADPHAWLDVRNAMLYVDNIAAALAAADPAGADHYRQRASAYRARLAELDTRLRARFGALPEARRTVVTPHDAFGYFAHAYGLRFLAPAGIANEAAPSARAVAELIEQLRALKVDRVFLETLTDDRLIERIGRETGARVGGTLYADALSRRDGADTYVGLMEHDLAMLAGP